MRDKDKDKDEIIYGRQTVKEALLAGNIKKVFLKKGQKGLIIDEIIDIARKNDIVCQFLNTQDFDAIAGFNTSNGGVAASVKSFRYKNIEDIVNNIVKEENPLILVLDHIEDPHNLGALIRTAEASGVAGVVIPFHRAVGVTASVRKVSAGATEWIPVVRVNNLPQTLDYLKDKGFWIYGAEEMGEVPYYNADWERPVTLVLGSEGRGITPLVQKKCDLLVGIPLKGKLNSLNVSVAGGILMSEKIRQKT